jgi:superfamily II DNA or RNA helicase
MSVDSRIKLHPAHLDSITRFLSNPQTKSLFAAPAGTGKAIAAMGAAEAMLSRGNIDAAIVISDRAVLREQWRVVAQRYGIDLVTALLPDAAQGISTTVQSLRGKKAASFF